MISLINDGILVLNDNALFLCASDNETEGLPRLTAGDGDHAGANQGPKRDRNSHVHALVAVATTEEGHIGG